MLSMMRSLCVVAVFCLSGGALWAQDESADGVVLSVDSAPVEEAPAAPPITGRTVYKSVDSKGMVTFIDTPPTGRPSEAIVVHAANTMPTGVSSGDGMVSKEKKEQVNYSVTITSPTNDQFFGQEVDSVMLNAQLEPGLQDGHTFQLYYDGKPVGDCGMSYTVIVMDRGTHTVEARVFDNKKKLLKASEKVQFHIRRITQLLPQQTDSKPKEMGAGAPAGRRPPGAIGVPGGGLGAGPGPAGGR